MNRKGIGVLEGVIGLLLMAILGVAFWRLGALRSVQVVEVEARGERIDIANTIREIVDCGRTFEAVEADCALKKSEDNFYIDLRNAAGEIVVSQSATNFGNRYRIKAKCVDLGAVWGLDVDGEPQQVNPGGHNFTFKLFPNFPLTCGKGGNPLSGTCPAISLPSGSTVALDETRNFRPSGTRYQYDQFMSTPVVGQLMATGFPSIVANGFKASSTTGADGGHLMPGYTFAFRMTSSGTEQHWVSPITTQSDASPAIADLDNDGVNEVVVAGLAAFGDPGVAIYALNGRTGAKIWSSKVPTPAPGDTSGDTILVDGIPQFPIRADYYGLKVADLDNDGKPEVILANAVLNGQTGNLKFWAVATGTRATVVKEVNGSEPGMEIIGQSGISSGIDGHRICKFPTVLCHVAVGRLHKYDPYETIVASRKCQNTPLGSDEIIYGFRSDNCKEIFATTLVGAGGGSPTIGNFDDDEDLEIGMSGRSYYMVFEANGAPKWKSAIKDASSESTGSTLFDLNGDGKMEIVYSDETTLRIYEGATGRVIYSTPNSSGTITEYPVIADVNDDGHADIVLSSNDYAFGNNKGIRIFTSPENDWIPARRIWNQHAYYVSNVKDNGSVVGIDPAAIWKPYMTAENQLGFHNNLPMRKRCAPPPPPCVPGKSFTFSTKEEITTWMNDYYGYEAFKNTGGTNSYASTTAATRQRICAMKGYNSVSSYSTTSFSFWNCSDNKIYEWKTTSGNWNVNSSCMGSQAISQLVCGCT